MSKKILRVSFPEKCIGCELCVMEAQRQLSKAGFEGSLIRIFRSKEDSPASTVELSYTIEMDPNVNDLDVEKIANSCPTLVFKVEEGDDEHNLLS